MQVGEYAAIGQAQIQIVVSLEPANMVLAPMHLLALDLQLFPIDYPEKVPGSWHCQAADVRRSSQAGYFGEPIATNCRPLISIIGGGSSEFTMRYAVGGEISNSRRPHLATEIA